jgi:peptidyl-prolyl cis-trans isomerase D
MLPDSVEARHILLQVNTQEEFLSQQALADSLKTLIENGANFATLAQQYSTDQGSAMLGGELGWFGRGQMVKPFEDAAFNNAKNEVSVVASQFGLHIIQTTNRGPLSKQVQIASLVRNVVPSTQTYQDTYAQASKFAGENTNAAQFNKAVTEDKLNKRVATVGENDRDIAGLENARTLIRAAYESKKGNIIMTTQGSPIFELGDNFVIAVLTEVTEEGEPSLESVKPRVELAVLKEKKADFLAEKAKAALQGKTDLQAVASDLNATVQSASNIDFTSFSVPGLGMEPAVIGTATSLGVDKISEPVKGNNGVYVLKVTSVNQLNNDNVEAEKTRLAQNINFRATSQAFEAQRKASEIVDKRSKFY